MYVYVYRFRVTLKNMQTFNEIPFLSTSVLSSSSGYL